MPSHRAMLDALRWMASFSDESLKTAATLHWDLVGKAKEIVSQPDPMDDPAHEIERLTNRVQTLERERKAIAAAMRDIGKA